MFGKKDQSDSRREKIDTLLGKQTTIEGDIQINAGGIHVEGIVKGNVLSDDAASVLIVGETGHIHGDVRVNNLILNGSIDGTVYAHKVELFDKARINGDIHYQLLELAVGAEVNGKLVKEDQVEEASPAKETGLEEKAKPV